MLVEAWLTPGKGISRAACTSGDIFMESTPIPSVCPSCQRGLAPDSRCPQCGQPAPARGFPGYCEPGPGWTQAPLGKVFAALLLVWALCHGLCQLAISVFHGVTPTSPELIPAGAAALFGILQAFALAVVSMVVSAGNRRGLVIGAGIGLLSAGIVVSLARLAEPSVLSGHPAVIYAGIGLPLSARLLYLLPAMFILAGALGGSIGARVWRPLEFQAYVAAGSAQANGVSVALPMLGGQRVFQLPGPLSCLRVTVGVLFAIGVGLLGCRQVITFLLAASEGALRIETQFQERIAIVEIFAIAILVGGCIAGATTRSGLNHGIGVGIGCAIAVVGMFLGGATRSMGDPAPFVFAAVFLGPLGGWFGGELLPPGTRKRRKRRAILDL
jgi:hypothetical protein